MPRPGPRPYECVRRAWHSDRHQPMRGSLIQEIFRVVNEIHSSTTRKNKEWQDKLPIVVLKVEEIIYSKANSEAEYMDLETLWDRANDAINTIIRLDETTETGVFLQPCVEAALNLGCIPMRTSRSQRNNTSTYYLNLKNTEPHLCPSNNLQKTPQETPMTVPPFVSHYSQMMKPPSINLSPFNLKPQIPIHPNDKCLKNRFSFPSPPSTKGPLVYPLYYGSDIEIKDPRVNYGDLKEPGFVKNRSSVNAVSKNDAPRVNLRYMSEEHSREHGCDLSLRLGPSQESRPYDMRDLDNSKKLSLESKSLGTEEKTRKRKAVDGNLYEDFQFCWRPKASSDNCNGG